MNVVAICGRITHTPELKQTPTGKAICSFSLAVDRPRVKDVTDFFNFIAWEKTAEYIAKYAQKGDTVEVSGVLTSRTFEDRQGAKKTAYEILVDSAHVIRKLGAPQESINTAPNPVSWEESGADSDLPF